MKKHTRINSIVDNNLRASDGFNNSAVKKVVIQQGSRP